VIVDEGLWLRPIPDGPVHLRAELQRAEGGWHAGPGNGWNPIGAEDDDESKGKLHS
jgi:hypothetical protein